MSDYLVCRLYAALASWGAPAVGESRPTATWPGRGAVLGLLGAALGIRRDDVERQTALDESVGFGVKQVSPGVLTRDYHTVQIPPPQKRVTYRTRRDELRVSKDRLNTILSSRDYRCDGLWTLALWSTPQATLSLDEIASAVERPRFMLYLGRKSCPLSTPLAPRIVQAGCLKDALDSVFEPGDGSRLTLDERLLGRVDTRVYAWEGGSTLLDGQAQSVESSEVWDQPLDRRRWQFTRRLEYRRFVNVDEAS